MWSNHDDGILRPFHYLVNVVCFDGAFTQRRETIFVISEQIGNKLLANWNHVSSLQKTMLPLYEYRKA